MGGYMIHDVIVPARWPAARSNAIQRTISLRRPRGGWPAHRAGCTIHPLIMSAEEKSAHHGKVMGG
jgi:hypothetical protein